MNIGAIIQARTSSTRLPGKVLKELPYGSGITVLQHVIRRLKRSSRLSTIIVATTTDKEDKKIVGIAQDENVKWFRGDREDVLGRYYAAAKKTKVAVIVRITSDCPCIDPEVVDIVLEEHLKTGSDYTSHKGFPHGLDTEVMNFAALEIAFKNASEDFEREHVTPYIYKTRLDLFKITAVQAPRALKAPGIRLTLDTEEDYGLLCAVFDYLYPKNAFFSVADIIKLFREKPWLTLINKKTLQKKIVHTLKGEIREAIKLCSLQDLKRAKEFLERHLHEGFHNN